MKNQSAGELLIEALKKLSNIIIKIVTLIVAWCFELAGNVLLKISSFIKSKT